MAITIVQRQELLRSLRAAHALARRDSSSSILTYLNHLIIDTPPGQRLLREVWEGWQWALTSRLVPALEAVAAVRDTPYMGPRNFWLQMGRGHDKTSLIGRLSSWLLAFSRRPLRAVAAAGDKEQAGLIHEFMQAEARLNPWLNEMLKFSSWRAEGPQGSRLRVLAADAAGAFGLKEDVVVCDELTHWPKRDMFNTLVTGMEKRAGQALLIVITNAGVMNTWQHDVYKEAKLSPSWYVYEAPYHLASWMPIEAINERRRILPAGLAKRVYDNKWIDPAEESGFVARAEAEACVDSSLRRQDVGIREHRPYYAAIDYGPVKDRTALCVLHEEQGRVVVDRLDVWQGSPDARVRIDRVEAWVEEAQKAYHGPRFVIDPYNLEGSLQKYEGLFDIERFTPRGGQANYQLAANLRSLMVSKKIAWYPLCGEILVHGRPHDLVDELCEVTLKPTSAGFRIINEGNTHDDRVCAIGMAALTAVTTSAKVRVPSTGRWF